MDHAVSPWGRLKGYTDHMSHESPSLLRIGPFSRLAQVTIKTLRFYDAAGIFRPVWVDPHSGYRYYCASQLPHLRRIRVLRELGCGVAELGRLALATRTADIPLQQELIALRRKWMVGLALAERRIRQLDAMLDGSRSPSTLPIRNRRILASPALTLRDCIRGDSPDIHRMFESVEREAARRNIRAAQFPFLLLHDMEYGRARLDVEVCVPVRREALDGAGARLVESVPNAACVRFAGDYEQAPILFNAALDTLAATDARIAGPIREVYLRFGADQRGYRLHPRFLAGHAGQYRTELQIPVRS